MAEDVRMERLLDAIESAGSVSELELAKGKLDAYKETLKS